MSSAAPNKAQQMPDGRGDLSLKGKHAIVTGAAGGIGRAIAKRLADAGAILTLIDITAEGMNFVDEFASRDHKRVVVDLRSKTSIRDFYEEYVSATGADILVNSAGVLNPEKCFDSDRQQWREIMAINVESILLLSQEVLPRMKEKKWGRIINLGSYAAKCGGITAGTAYSTSKAAVDGLTRSIAREFAPYGITANVIAPAYVMSPMVSAQLNDEERSIVLNKIPAGRFCDPEEVAHAAAFLADEKAGFITGEVINVTGGLSLG